jgi:PAS domain S-box-containing protein
MRALVVEDEQDMARQLKRILEKKFSLSVEMAYDCATAREKISEGVFDIVTLDFMLPDGRGLDFLEEITPGGGGPPRVIMVTGHGDEETAVRSFRSSASGYVVKDSHLNSRLAEAVEKAMTEISLRRAQDELRRREQHFRTLIEKASDLITVVSPDGIIMYASPSIDRILGHKPEVLIGSSVLALIHPDDRERILGIAQRVIDTPGAIAVLELRLLHKDGPWRAFECLARNVLDDPAVEGIVINSRDITLRKQNDERLRKYREQLEELVEARTSELAKTNLSLQQEIIERKQAELELKGRAESLADFLTVASHELRHPISVVKGYTTMLEGYLERMDPEDMQGILGALNIAVDRLTHFVEELLQVSLVEQGRFTFRMRQVQLEPLLNSAVADMKALGHDNEITVSVSDDANSLAADPDKLIQLLVILLDNAVKFSPPASPIELEARLKDDRVVMSVTDRGIGVPEKDEELIFDRFYQVEEVMHHSKVGLGLGLYLARQIVGGHDGEIHHRQRDGGGSVFKFCFARNLCTDPIG